MNRLSIVLLAATLSFHTNASALKPYSGTEPEETSGTIPANFRGEIQYVGQQSAEVTTPGKAPRLNNRNILGSIISAAGNSKTQNFSGTLNLTIVYDGNTVRGRYAGTGGLIPGSFTGTRRGDVCTTYDDRDGTMNLVRCNENEYSGTFTTPPNANPKVKGQYSTVATKMIDYVERDRLAVQRQAEVQSASRAAAIQREADARTAAAAYAALPNAGSTLTRQLDGFVQTDSLGWASNRYNTGSMSNVKIVEGSVRSGNYVMRGEFTYAGGAEGWVMAKMGGGQFECIQFQDTMTGCRPLRTPGQGQAVSGAILEGIFSGGGTSGGNSKSGGTCTFGRDSHGPILGPC